MTLDIAVDGVKTDMIQNKAVTPAKIQGGTVGQLLVTNVNNEAKWVDATDEVIKEFLKGNQAITELVDLGTGQFTYFNEGDYDADGNRKPGAKGITFDANTLRIEEVPGTNGKGSGTYNFFDKSKDTPIGTVNVTESVINNITGIFNSEEVKNEIITVVDSKSKDLASTDGSVAVTGGEKSTLKAVTVNIAEKGIKTGHIADGQVTSAKISSENAVKGTVLTADGLGKANFTTVTETVAPAMRGNLVGEEDVIKVDGGNKVLYGDDNKNVKVSIVAGGITSTHIKNETIVNDDIANKTITAVKLDATGATKGAVATVNADGTVSYQPLTSNAITENTASLKTDGIITVGGLTEQKGTLFTEANLGIADGGINTPQLADNAIKNDKIDQGAVTVDKISAGATDKKKVMVTDDNGIVKWGELDDLVTDAAGNLTTDNIIEFTVGDGVNSLFNNVGLGIKDNSITKGKLSSADEAAPGSNIAKDRILVTDGDGGFDYVTKDAVLQGGKDLKLGNTLEFTQGDGLNALLVETHIDVAAQGITTEKLAEGAVTVTKISSTGADKNTVLTADGQGKVTYVKLSETAFEGKGADLTSDGSLLIPSDNNAALKATTIGIAQGGVKSGHIADQNVTVKKISSENAAAGRVLTSDGQGGATFQTLREVLGDHGKALTGDTAIHVEGGDHATLSDVQLTLNNASITNEKLATDAVGTTNIQNKAITTTKISGEKQRTILITDEYGEVKWADANDNVIGDIVAHTESLTVLRDNTDGTFTYFAENQVDNKGNVKEGAVGVTFNANTLSIDNSTPGIYVLKDKSKANNGVVGTIDTRASHIIFEGDTTYTSVEEAITNITQKIEQLESAEIDKKALSGQGILVNGKDSEADVVLKEVELSIADNAITTSKLVDEHVTAQKIKGGTAKQLLVTNNTGKAEWVDASSDIIKDIIQTQERVTMLEDNKDGTFTYFSEKDVDKDGNKVGGGVTFDANTLKIEVLGKGKYEFYDKSQVDPLATIDVSHDVIENILEIIKEVNVQEEIYKVIAAQGKAVSTDNSIEVVGGEQAALHEMTISLKEGGVTTEKIKDGAVIGSKIASKAVTEDKLFASTDKKDYVPVVQSDGSVKYQPMSAVVTGEMLAVDSSLKITGDASKAVLQEFGLQVSEGGIGNEHLKTHAVTVDKIGTTGADKGDVLIADGSGNAQFIHSKTVLEKAMHGDLISDNSLVVEGGENTLFGDEEKKAIVKINTGGVSGTHIQSNAISNLHIQDGAVSQTKLTAGSGEANRVAIANAEGVVTYQVISSEVIGNKGDIKTDNIITVDNGVDKVLADVTIGLNDNSVTPAKLSADGAATGSVATVGANGLISYQPISTHVISNKGNLTTDEVIVVDNGVDKLLGDMKLSIKNKGITNDQLADKSVTAENISSKGIGEKRVLISGKNDEVVWGELGDIVTNTAGNLTTDNIIEMTKGDGVNSLLADVALGIKNNSITRDKLSSIEGDNPVGKDKILVTNDAGGFDFVDQNAVQVGGKDLTVGNALQFTKGNGLNTVLVETGIDVKAGGITNDKIAPSAVTVEKLSAGDAASNTVLTSIGQGKVEYKALSNTAFEGQGADLKSDGSIKVTEANKALLNEATIAIEEGGVDTKHLKAKGVTTDKISSVDGKNNVGKGMFLAADGQGATTYQSMEQIASVSGKAVTSTDNSITVTAGNKAALQDLNLAIATGGVKTAHIAARQVTSDKIAADKSQGLVLTSDGQGGANFESLGTALSETAKPLQGGAGISVTGTGASKALLGDATVSIADSGVNAFKLASNAVETAKIKDGAVTNVKLASNAVETVKIKDKAVTEDKIANNAITSSKIANGAVSTTQLKDKAVNAAKMSSDLGGGKYEPKGYVLIATGDGTVEFQAPAGTTTGDLSGSSSIEVSNGKSAVLQNTTVTVKAGGIGEAQLANNAVTNSKIQNLAIDNFKIKNATISGGKLIDGAVTKAKISAEGKTIGHVLTVESGGKVSFKAPTGSSITKKNITKSNTIKAVKGEVGSVLEEVQLEVNDASIRGVHIAYNTIGYTNMGAKAVGNAELRENAVADNVIKDKGITIGKISSHGAPVDEVLTSDGKGGAFWAPAKGGNSNKAAMPKFFYAPSFYVSVEPGESATINVYGVYERQFGTPIKVNPNAQAKSLPVLKPDELDYYVLYYDEDVFSDVKMLDNGKLDYKVKSGVRTTTETYFNIAFGVRD